MSPFQASALVGCMRPHALFRVEGSEGAGMGGGGRGWGRDGEGRGGTGRGGEGGGAHARGAGAQQRPRGLRSRPCESTSPRGRAHTILERVRGGPPSEPRREHRHIAIPPCFRALRRFLPQCFFAPFGASRQQHRPPNAPRALPKVGAVWLRGRCQLGSRMRPYEFMSARGRAPTVPVQVAGAGSLSRALPPRWAHRAEHKFLPDRAWGRDSRKKCAPPSRSGPPWELRREYRHIALPHVFSSRPSAPQRKPRPPNAPRDQPTRGALWLSCRRPSCQSGSRTRSYESMSPQGRAHTSRERGLEKALPTQSPRDLVEYGGFCARPCPSKRRAEKDRTDRPRQEAAMGRSPPPQRNRNPRGARDHWRASRSFVDCSSGESNDLN